MNPNPVSPPQGQAAQSAMPIVALVLALIGFCIPPLFLVAIVLAIISLARSSEPAYAGRKVMAIITLVLTLIYVPVVGILAAIAIPNFIKFQARSKQSECKVNLKAAFTAQRAYQLDKNDYGDTAEDIGFAPERGNRYLYLVGSSRIAPTAQQAETASALLQRAPPNLVEEVGKQGNCPDDCSVVMACVGNIDNDSTVDVWTISTAERTIRGELVPAGVPHNDQNDVTD